MISCYMTWVMINMMHDTLPTVSRRSESEDHGATRSHTSVSFAGLPSAAGGADAPGRKCRARSAASSDLPMPGLPVMSKFLAGPRRAFKACSTTSLTGR